MYHTVCSRFFFFTLLSHSLTLSLLAGNKCANRMEFIWLIVTTKRVRKQNVNSFIIALWYGQYVLYLLMHDICICLYRCKCICNCIYFHVALPCVCVCVCVSACVWAIYPQMCHANSNTLNSGFRNLDQHFNTTRKTKIKKKEKDKNKTHSTSSKQARLEDTLHTFYAK